MYREDTTADAQTMYDAMIRNLSEEERFLKGLSLTHFARQMCYWGIRNRYPGLADKELRREFFELVYGDLFRPEQKEKIYRTLK